MQEVAAKIAEIPSGESGIPDRTAIFQNFMVTNGVSHLEEAIREKLKPIVALCYQKKSISERSDSEREQESNRLENASRIAREDLIMGKRYSRCNFENYELIDESAFPGDRRSWTAIRKHQESVVDAAHQYADSIHEMIANGTNLILRGPTGTGKDHLAASIAKVISRSIVVKTNHWHRVIGYCNGPSLFADLRNSMHGGRSELSIIRDLVNVDVLLLSDPVLTDLVDLTQFQRDALYRIVDERSRHSRPIICTINAKDDDKMREILGDQTAGRLLHGAIVLDCTWPDYRSSQIEISAIRRSNTPNKDCSAV